MVSAKTLVLTALSASAVVAAPHRRYKSGHCKVLTRTEYATSITYVSTTTAAAAVTTTSTPEVTTTVTSTSTITMTTTTIPVVAPTTTTTTAAPTTTAAAGNFAAQATSAAAAVTSAAAAPVVSTPVVGASSGAKKGLAYNDPSLLSLFSGSGSSWAYNWGSGAGGNIPSGLEYVPMCWGRDQAPTCADKILPQNPKHILSFNEPDQEGQAHMDVGEAVALHKQYIAQPFSGKAKIGSPAVTNGEKDNMGLSYMKQFLDGCAGQCNIDFLNVHWYWPDTVTEADFENRFVKHMNAAVALAGQYGINSVWLTEFSSKGSAEPTFVKMAVDWLETQPKIERYAYFMVGNADGMGMVNGKALNAVGDAYA